MKKAISIFEIMILVLSSISFSYLFYESTAPLNEIKIVHGQSFVGEVLKKILNKIKEPLIPLASAEVSFNCCEKTVNNSFCQDVLDIKECQTGKQIAPTSCEATNFCNLGCCEDPASGTFDKNTPKILCKAPAIWHEGKKNCDVPTALLGCCVLADGNTLFVTQRQCEIASAQGIAKTLDWRKIGEASCVEISVSKEEGACAYGNNMCKFTTRRECIQLSGSSSNFHPNYLCTSPSLNTSCEKTQNTKCFSGNDEVYFIDSCGNKANIYDASKINDAEYWNKVFSKNESCGANSENNNGNSAVCGNCFRFGKGSFCAPTNSSSVNPQFGNNFCKETSCTFKGQKYMNGESWCVYDGAIGNGDDVVGSRHWKYVCNLGEVRVEPCADYRNQICIQKNTFETEGGNISFRNANCVANNGKNCLELNTEKGGIAECAETLNCEVKEVNVDGSFNFKICTPKYPPAFQLNVEGQRDMAKEICGLVSRTCVVQYKEKTFGGCECVDNCECEDATFTQQMNEVCNSLGDCGLEANILGKYTKNYKVSGAPGLNSAWISKITALAKPVPGQYAVVENYSKYLEAAGLLNSPGAGGGDKGGGGSNFGMYAGLGIVGVGYALGAVSVGSLTGFGSAAYVSWTFLETSGPVLGAMAGAAIAAGIGMFVGSMLAKFGGASPGFAMVASIAGGVAVVAAFTAGGGFTLGGFSFGTLGTTCAAMAAVCIVMIVALIVMIIASFMGSKCKPKKVTFTCKPWEPPAGGSDCEKCNKDPLKPCSEYRCSSLGASCKLVNKGTTEEMCINQNHNDSVAPKITPNGNYTNLTNTRYLDINPKGFRITDSDGGCVDAYTNLVWGINTDEPAQCKFDTEMRDKWDDFEYDLGSGAYKYEHISTFMLPDIDGCGLNISDQIKFYIKCRDSQGNEIPGFYTTEICINKGPDRTPPLIIGGLPANDGLVSFSASEKNVSIFTNEPVNCKWSKENKEYGEMENGLACKNECDDMGVGGYQCDTILPIENTTNTFYFKCEDQPWNADNGSRNLNSQSFVYTLKRPSSGLNITGIAPSADFEIFASPSIGKLRVQTSGGGQYPKCSYRVAGYSLIQMQTTFQPVHEQEIPWRPGFYNIYVECEDETGDRVSQETNFEILQDFSSPEIARLFRNGNTIKFATSENAECRYSSDSENGCLFNFNNASSTGTGTSHSFSMQEIKQYFIKCKDNFGNAPDGCTIVISPAI